MLILMAVGAAAVLVYQRVVRAETAAPTGRSSTPRSFRAPPMLQFVLLLAIPLVHSVMAAQCESLRDPLIIYSVHPARR